MKNVTLKSLVILILILLFLAFKGCNPKQNSNNYQIPQGLITDSIANIYEEAYKQKELEKNEIILGADHTPIDDYREVWFELEEVENYIKYVKHNADSLGLENLGLRVYFGAKEDGNGTIKNTAFFVPTHDETTRSPQDSTSARTNTPIIKKLNMGDPGMTEFETP